MESFVSRIQNEKGSAIIIAVMVLAVVSIIGISTTSTTDVELRITANDKCYRTAFYEAEGGLYGFIKIVKDVVDKDEMPDLNTIGCSLPDAGTDTSGLFDQIYGFSSHTEELDLVVTNTSGMADGYIDVAMDIRRLPAKHAVGGGVEFATGAEGVGMKAAIEIPYRLLSEGDSTGSCGAIARIVGIYKKLLGVGKGI